MIDAFIKAHSLNSDSYLYFIGDGEEEHIKNFSKEKGLEISFY
jgi:hypothetical protein